MSGERAMLLESENLLMKMKIQKLEFDLESEKIRCRHFEGISTISLMELQKGNWVNAADRSNRLSKLMGDLQSEMRQFEAVRTDMVIRFCKLESIISSINSILQ